MCNGPLFIHLYSYKWNNNEYIRVKYYTYTFGEGNMPICGVGQQEAGNAGNNNNNEKKQHYEDNMLNRIAFRSKEIQIDRFDRILIII